MNGSRGANDFDSRVTLQKFWKSFSTQSATDKQETKET